MAHRGVGRQQQLGGGSAKHLQQQQRADLPNLVTDRSGNNCGFSACLLSPSIINLDLTLFTAAKQQAPAVLLSPSCDALQQLSPCNAPLQCRALTHPPRAVVVFFSADCRQALVPCRSPLPCMLLPSAGPTATLSWRHTAQR
jgi:hypothetical protein